MYESGSVDIHIMLVDFTMHLHYLSKNLYHEKIARIEAASKHHALYAAGKKKQESLKEKETARWAQVTTLVSGLSQMQRARPIEVQINTRMQRRKNWK